MMMLHLAEAKRQRMTESRRNRSDKVLQGRRLGYPAAKWARHHRFATSRLTTVQSLEMASKTPQKGLVLPPKDLTMLPLSEERRWLQPALRQRQLTRRPQTRQRDHWLAVNQEQTVHKVAFKDFSVRRIRWQGQQEDEQTCRPPLKEEVVVWADSRKRTKHCLIDLVRWTLIRLITTK
jgi:hypothetical protein